MKNIFLGAGMFLFSLNLSAQGGQVPNPGFETWSTNVIYETPEDWFNSNQFNTEFVSVFKSDDAQNGSSSAEVRIFNEYDFAFVGLGQLADGPTGGIPYTSNFTNVKFWYKADFETTDSVYIYIIRYLNGLQVGEYTKAVSGGNQNSWTEAEASFPAGTQDHLFIAFLTGTPEGEENNSPGSWFRIDNVRMFDGSTQLSALPNFSFENWNDVSVEDPADWYSVNGPAMVAGFPTSTKSTDAHSGNFAAQLKTTYSEVFDEDLPGVLSMTDLNGNAVMEGIPYTATPASLSVWYKFTPSSVGDDEASITVMFYKNDMQLDNYDVYFTEAANYTELVIPFDLQEQPDSINLIFFSGANDGATLKIDDIQFSGGTVGLDQFSKSNLSVFPNPATDRVMIKAEGFYSWEIVALSGNTVLSGATSTGVQEINVSELNAGTYFIRFNNDSANGIHKLVIQ